MKKIHVSGYQGFLNSVAEFEKDGGGQLNLCFSGHKDDTGKSWCPDCNEAEPVIDKALNEYAAKNSIFVEVDVGDRATWKDMKNQFRKDSNLKLQEIPTLLRWKSVQRLNGLQCAKMDLLELFFTDE